MELFLVLVAFVTVLAALSAKGWTADSRDSADWQPSSGGFRASLRTRRS